MVTDNSTPKAHQFTTFVLFMFTTSYSGIFISLVFSATIHSGLMSAEIEPTLILSSLCSMCKGKNHHLSVLLFCCDYLLTISSFWNSTSIVPNLLTLFRNVLSLFIAARACSTSPIGTFSIFFVMLVIVPCYRLGCSRRHAYISTLPFVFHNFFRSFHFVPVKWDFAHFQWPSSISFCTSTSHSCHCIGIHPSVIVSRPRPPFNWQISNSPLQFNSNSLRNISEYTASN